MEQSVSDSASSDEQEDEEAFSDELSSSPSVPEADIDFEHVYALHTFLATVEGQASVSKGDNLTLLDDSNSYWWLVRVLKTQAVGYIPAENIETPFERLARLNKHRNVDLSSATQEDHATGSGSAQAKTRVVPAQGVDGSRTSPYQGPPGGKSVAFAAPTYFEHSDNEESDEYDYHGEEDGMDGEFEAEEGFDEDDYGPAELVEGPHRADAPELSGSESDEAMDAQASPLTETHHHLAGPQPAEARSSFGVEGAGTRKLTLTPDIARDASASRKGAAVGLDAVRPPESHVRPARNQVQSSEVPDGSLSPSLTGSDDAARGQQRKLRKAPPTAASGVSSAEDGSEAKKKKTGGMFSGLFRKKEKGRGDANDDDASSSASASERRISSPLESRSPIESEDDYLVDATSRQQQIEARQALYSQYGISRGANDVSNTFVARSSSLEVASSLSPSAALAPHSEATPVRPLRPGSLLGSPSVGGDVPMLSVMRVFAGDDVEADATFKTVLLNESTSSAELLRQAIQRFRLSLQDIDKYYLSVKDLASGHSDRLEPAQHPLPLLERLNQNAETLPSVRRSSMGSISSLSSNLSMHPAIEKLGMNDYSDDSAVKIFLHAHAQPGQLRGDTSAGDYDLPSAIAAVSPAMASGSISPSLRFAARLAIHRNDLPEGVVFDPDSSAIVPQTLLAQRSGQLSPGENERKRLLMFPANVTVAEAIETSLERFGIIDGVVHGGDEIEDRVSKRRSSTRVRYCLVARTSAGRDVLLSPSSRLLEAYSSRPKMRPPERPLKEANRFSLDAPPGLSTSEDEPVFVLRNYALFAAPARKDLQPASPRSVDALRSARPPAAPARTPTSDSVYMTPDEEPSTPASVDAQRQIINAQRAASRANQRAILSAQRNEQSGVDLQLSDQTVLRSSRQPTDARNVRYSLITHDSDRQYDVSSAIEAEWHSPPSTEPSAPTRGPAPTRPADLLEPALDRQMQSPDHLMEQRIDRALARVQSSPRSTSMAFASEAKNAAKKTRRPLYRFDERIDHIRDIVLLQPVPASAQRLLQQSATKPSKSVEEELFGGPMTMSKELETAVARWFGVSLNQLYAIESSLDELLLTAISK